MRDGTNDTAFEIDLLDDVLQIDDVVNDEDERRQLGFWVLHRVNPSEIAQPLKMKYDTLVMGVVGHGDRQVNGSQRATELAVCRTAFQILFKVGHGTDPNMRLGKRSGGPGLIDDATPRENRIAVIGPVVKPGVGADETVDGYLLFGKMGPIELDTVSETTKSARC